MTGEGDDFQWVESGEEGDEPDTGSSDNVGDQLKGIDEELRRAGKIPPEQPLSEEEIRQRIRDKVNELQHDGLEVPENAQREIRRFLTTLRIRGADQVSGQEIELLWGNVLKNASLVKDLTFIIAERKTKNNYSEYPLLPDIKELLEFADDLSNPETLRPRMIREACDNLDRLGLTTKRPMEIMMGSSGDELADAMRLLGWISGMPFMRGASQELRKHSRDMGLEEVTMESMAHSFIVIISQNIMVLKEREKSYHSNFSMDHMALNRHGEVIAALTGILDTLYATFVDK